MRHCTPRIAWGLGLVVLATFGLPARSSAEIWCAGPLYVHEWGVVVFGPAGAARSMPSLPAHFHRRAGGSGTPGSAPPAVRHLPPDSGLRALPVVQFYGAGGANNIPLGLAVGFRDGEATHWFPQVDGRRRAVDANSATARSGRAALLRARAARAAHPTRAVPLGRDPTRQLAWDHLDLTTGPSRRARATTVPWVNELRAMPSALWVNSTRESERFLFYEGRTRERPALEITRGPTYGRGRHHFVFHNRTDFPVHDVIFLHRNRGAEYVFYTPSIPARRSAGFVMEAHRRRRGQPSAETRLRIALIDATQPRPPTSYSWGSGNCVMMRDPAVPTERASGHRLYGGEVDAIVHAWGPQFFGAGRASHTAIVYREDTAFLDAAMPISVYTDMFHFVDLRRAGLALIDNVTLP